MSGKTTVVAAVLALCVACGVAHARTQELRIAQQYGFSYLQLMYMQHDRLIEKHAQAADGCAISDSQIGRGAPL